MPEFDPLRLSTHPISERASKVRLEHLAPPAQPLPGVLDLLPRVFAADDLRLAVSRIAAARRGGRPVLAGMGAHVIKCGCGPILIDLARRGILTGFSANGAMLVHDTELALFGHTSEEVAQGLRDGTFGMAEETQAFVNGAIRDGVARGMGLGEAVGKRLMEVSAPFAENSLLAQAAALSLPFTIHVAIGTDILHMHPSADGAAIGEGSLRDFRRLVEAVSGLAGGVLLNLGSAVVLPEVMLKAFAVLRNQGAMLDGCLAVDLDMIRSYRSTTQLVDRIRHLGGRGVALTGHHEIMIPLLAGLVLAELDAESASL